MPLTVGSDARIYSPRFTDLDEEPAWCTPSQPTVAVVSQRTGTTLAAPTATSSTETGVHQVTLTAAAHLTQLDALTVTWSGSTDGVTVARSQVVPVAGAVYVPTTDLAQLRTVPESGTVYPFLRGLRDAFEDLAERARGVAFVPRWATESHRVPASGTVVLDWPRARELTSLTVDGFDYDVDAVDLDPAASTVRGLPADTLATFGYTHGYDAPPQALVEACREWVRSRALTETSDHARNLLSYTDLSTGAAYRYGTADWSEGRFTGIMAVDDLIRLVPDEREPRVA